LLLAQRNVTERDLSTLAAKVLHARGWPVRSVLTHYDNRLDNLIVDHGAITVLDRGLSPAGTGIAQEVIKLFESGPMSMQNPRVAAFLRGYGLTDRECERAIGDGQLMLVLDGLAMSYGRPTNRLVSRASVAGCAASSESSAPGSAESTVAVDVESLGAAPS
jgi:hypothetical protein